MTIKNIKERIQTIRETAEESNDLAHQYEDELYRDFVEYVANLRGLSAELCEKAQLVHSVQSIDYTRWYS